MTDLPQAAIRAAYDAGVAAERERIRQLAINHDARYIPGCGNPNCPHPTRHMATAPFAGLLTAREATRD